MNNLAFESGAGTSLLFGPLLNPTGATGVDALQLAQTLVRAAGRREQRRQPLREGHSADNAARLARALADVQPFTSSNPAIAPTNATGCSLSSDDNPGARRAPSVCADYECDSTTLHLPDRAAQDR